MVAAASADVAHLKKYLPPTVAPMQVVPAPQLPVQTKPLPAVHQQAVPAPSKYSMQYFHTPYVNQRDTLHIPFHFIQL